MSDYSSVGPPQSQNINQSSAFAAALQRAKQIAAKIHPSGQGNKRPLEDAIDTDSKKFGGSDYSNSQSPVSSMSPAAMQAAAQAAAVAARLGQGSNSNSSNNSDRNNMNGPRDAVARARDMIMKIVNQHGNGPEPGNPQQQQQQQQNNQNYGNNNSGGGGGGGGGGSGGGGGGGGGGGQNNNGNYHPYQEIMVPGPKVGLVIGKGGETIKMLQEKTGAKMVVIQDGPGQELEKPLRISGDPQKVEHAKKLVYELIQDKTDPQQPGGGFNRGPGSGNGNGNNYQGGEQAEVFVPKIAVGVVIGKGGDMIKKIQGETGCKLQFIQGRGDGPGDRRCLIQGTKQQVDEGRQMIEDLIESVTRRNEGNEMNNRNNSGNGYNTADYSQQMREEYTFSVPASKCGIIIGRGGDTIKQINQQSGAHCEMDRKTQGSSTEKSFIIKGTPEQIEHARSLISEKIGMEIKLVGSNGAQLNSGYGMQSPSSNPYQQWGYPQSWDQNQSQMQAAQGGQADYSQQWIEYYRSMGMHREAEMIEQQLKGKQGGPGAPSGQVAVSGANNQNPQQPQQAAASVPGGQASQMHGAGQPDYSAQWAEYYRSIGKIDEAEAIENQIKAAKPGGQSGQIPASGAVTMPSGGGYPATGAAGQNPMVAGYGGQYAQYYPGQPGYPGYGAYGAYQGQQPQGQPQQPPQPTQPSDNKN